MKAKNILSTFITLIIVLSLTVNSNAQKRKVSANTKKVVSQKGNLSIEAGIVFTSGDVQHIARVEIYLLNKDMEDILKEANR